MKCIKLASLMIALIVLSACGDIGGTVDSSETPPDPTGVWAVQSGFAVDVDTDGFQLPTAIAFVPSPGDRPEDPLYFVSELRGKLKVVTNDRTVHTFAEDFFDFETPLELPAHVAQNGLVSVCLAPQQGYVFVTFAYQDEGNELRNNIVRFQTEPVTFSTKPASKVEFADIFSADRTTFAHQIGHCQVADEGLYVSVGDAHSPGQAGDLNSTNGKILRLSFDGEPIPDNPFYEDNNVEKTTNYVWAYGFRNPFGIEIVEERLFVAENGPAIDRFLEIHRGEDYLWDGTDWSIGTNADVVFSPSIAPVQLDYYPDTLSIFPDEFSEKFFLALWGDPTSPAGVVMLDYGFGANKMVQVPEYFLRYRGPMPGIGNPVIAVALGPGGLYFAPLFSDQTGSSAVFKVTYNPANEHAQILSNLDPFGLMIAYGCFGCHQLSGSGGTLGPPLDREQLIERIGERLNSDEYRQASQELDRLEVEPFGASKEARQEVLDARGTDQVQTWLKYRLLEPRFDDPGAQMPNLGLSESEALIIANHLVAEKRANVGSLAQQLKAEIDQLLQPLRYRHLIASFALGIFLAGVLFWTIVKFGKFMSRRRSG